MPPADDPPGDDFGTLIGLPSRRKPAPTKDLGSASSSEESPSSFGSPIGWSTGDFCSGLVESGEVASGETRAGST